MATATSTPAASTTRERSSSARSTPSTWYEFKNTPYTYVDTAWYHIDFSVVGNSLTCTVTDPGGHTTATLTDTESYFPSGGAGVTGDTSAEFDNYVVTAL